MSQKVIHASLNVGMNSLSYDFEYFRNMTAAQGPTMPATDVTVHANDDDEIYLVCHQCGNFKTIDASPYKLISPNMKATCERCGYTFTVSINFRKSYRKKTNLHGICTIIDYCGFDDKDDWENMSGIIVEDISRTGIGFRIKSALHISVGSILEVTFRLDNREGSMVTKKVIVRRVSGDYIGAEFITHVNEREKDLGFYLLP